MSFRISGQNLDVGAALRDRINDRVAEAMAKYFDGGYSGHLTLARDGFGFRAECAIHLDSKITLHAEGMAPDAYASADQAALRIEKRLRRYHRRLKDHRSERADERAWIDAASYVIGAPVVVFRHAAHGGINIVYRRADGHFGWIDPQATAPPDAH